MAKHLIIVESPAKARTITKIVGRDFAVTSSMGHVIDLPASKLGVDVEHDFTPQYIVIRKRGKIAKQLKLDAKGKQDIYLATDPDREGEAISWHLANLITEDARKQADKRAKRKAEADGAAAVDGNGQTPPAQDAAPAKPAKKSSKKSAKPEESNGLKIYRITFHEITPQAVKAALQHPGEIDLRKVNAQQARRVLDRLVGYSLSPLLWKKVGRGLSAGRVQSVALRLTVDREKEIEAFVPQEYWTLDVDLTKSGHDQPFKARVEKIGDQKINVTKAEDAHAIAEELRRQAFSVIDVEEKEQKRYPRPPFTTSTLQQEAFHKLGYSSSRTMRIAQQLYEGLEMGEEGPVGLITYMRTDAVRVADEALSSVRSYIGEQFGKESVPAEPRFYKAKKGAQEAHEAVRPTNVSRHPDAMRSFLRDEQWALYQMIWQRFVASQMSDAVDRVVAVRIEAGKYTLKANGRNNVMPGWTQVYRDGEEKPVEEGALPEGVLPPLAKGDGLTLLNCVPGQHFTKPPRRFTDASLVKALEEQGIGRPSTYAPIIQTIVSRDYVRRQGGSLVPTQLGRMVTEMLVEHFPEILDVRFTAAMEEKLDSVEDGDQEWVSVVRDFYGPFAGKVTTAQENMREVKREVIPTEHVCEKCGKQMVIKWGRFGQFLSCSAYPDCKNAKPMPTGVACTREGCGGQLVERRARGRIFYGCSNYPTCTHTERRLPKKEE
jgi:DNA topoisomerase-1